MTVVDPAPSTGVGMSDGQCQIVERSTLNIKTKSLPKQALQHMHYSIKRHSGKLNTMLISNEFNKLQINETVEKGADGNVIRRSLMLNIRCNDVDEADKLYRQLKARFSSNTGSKGKSEAAGNGGNDNVPKCACGRPMVLRQGKKGKFYGCSGYPQCQRTRELNGRRREEIEEVPVIEMPVF